MDTTTRNPSQSRDNCSRSFVLAAFVISHPLGIRSGNSRIWADFAQASLSTDWFLPSTTATPHSPRESPLVNMSAHCANSPREAKRTERISANSTNRKVCSRFCG